ncbi:unnamed protein product [Caretta caretta]
MELLDNPPAAATAAQSYGKGARRKNRFKGSDGSTSSDTTSNSFVRQKFHEVIKDVGGRGDWWEDLE